MTRIAGKWEVADLLHRGSRCDVLGVVGRDDLVIKLRHPVRHAAEKAKFDPEVVYSNLARSQAIVPIVDFGETEDRSFVVAERIRGAMTLASSLADIGPLAPRAALPILYRLVRGVSDLHRAGIAHRNLRAENVMLGPNGGRPPRVYIMGLEGALQERSACRADLAALGPIFDAVVARPSRPASFEQILAGIGDFIEAQALLESLTQSLLLDALLSDA